jgi:phosphoribosylformylglycinamidine synthase subunit PurQ / glutaminase
VVVVCRSGRSRSGRSPPAHSPRSGLADRPRRLPGARGTSWYRGLVAQRIGVVVFPGTNCEHDVAEAVEVLGAEAELVWHGSASLDGFDAVVLPGGFAHGDYLRPGAIARFSPVMRAVGEFSASGGPVVGICNGFQVLTEAHLLPGALQKNKGLTFLCQMTELEVVSDRSVLTAGVPVGRRLSVPINHFEGNYTAEPATLQRLEAEGRVVLRYADNPNGSANDIAGVCNEAGNVVGLMPHPERASSDLLGSTDGLVLLRALLAAAGGGWQTTGAGWVGGNATRGERAAS